MHEPIVSVCMITYNHGAFLATAIESILSQVTDYKFEIIISDDSSKDNTCEIIRKYAALYPDIIRPIYNKENIGMQRNFAQSLMACKGKYIAVLEGDDYWTDSFKLQKQIDFLEQNPDYSMCITSIDLINKNGEKIDSPCGFTNFEKSSYTIEEYIVPSERLILVPMMTLVARNILIWPLPDFFYKVGTSDMVLTLLFFLKGKLYYINEKTAVYREHLGGISKSVDFQLKLDRYVFDMFDGFNDYTRGKYYELIKQRIFPLSKTLLMYWSSKLTGKERKIHISNMFSGYKKYRTKINIKEVIYYKLVLYYPILLKFFKKISKG